MSLPQQKGATSLSAELLNAPDMRQLSAEEEEEVKRSQAAMDELLDQDGLAKYKLEVLFNHERSVRNLTPASSPSGRAETSFTEAATLRCMSVRTRFRTQSRGYGVGGFIPDSCNGLNYVVCPHCHLKWEAQYMVGEVFYRLPLQKWAEVLARWYHRMNGRTDISVKYAKMSVRDAQQKEALRGLRGELLNKV